MQGLEEQTGGKPMRTIRLLMVTAALGVFSGGVGAEEAYRVVGVWPEAPHGWHFYHPCGIAVDQSDNVYVSDSGNYRIKKFDSEGRFITQWGGPGPGDGQFHTIFKLRVGSSGIVYAFDQDRDKSRILKFTAYGQFVGTLVRKTPDVDTTQFPLDLTTDDRGNILVLAVGYRADADQTQVVRIEKYSQEGEFISQWGVDGGSSDGQLQSPQAMAVGAKGDIYIADYGNHRVQKFDSSGRFLAKWGGFGEDDGHFCSPISIAIDQSGSVYVVDDYSVQKFTFEGEFLARWKTTKRGRSCIALDSHSNVYVTCAWPHTVVKLDSSGRTVAEWASAGRNDGRFIEPQGIAVDENGKMYVAETQRNRVQKLDSTGKFLSGWSYAPGVGGTNFWDAIPRAMTTDPSGDVYVLSYSVQKFDPRGTLLAKWGKEGKGDGQFHGASGIALDRSGNIYVADTLNHRVQKLTPQGRFVAKWGTEGTGDGQLKWPECIMVDQSGNVLVADKINDALNRIQKFDPQGKFIAKWTVPCQVMAVDIFGNSYGPFRETQGTTVAKYDSDGNPVTGWGNWDNDDSKLGRIGGIFVDATGYVYVTDAKNSCIKKFNSSGKFISAWPVVKPDPDGKFEQSSLAKIAVDSSGNMYVADDSYTWIRKVTRDGELATKFQMEPPAAEAEFYRPRGVAVDSRGSLYIADLYPNNWRVQKFDPAGGFIRQWAERERTQLPAFYDYLNHPPSVAVDNKANTYVAVMEGEDHSICMSDANGRLIRKWGSKGIGDGQFDSPEGIAADGAGHVYVCDRQNCRIQKFDSDGRFLTKWGKEGSGDGEFHFPAAVAVDREGNVFVADSDNHRVQKFTAEGKFLTEWGEFGDAPGQFNVPLGIAVDAVGNVYVSDSHNHRIQKFAPVASR
jgi:tripartite motif-containing protein 71